MAEPTPEAHIDSRPTRASPVVRVELVSDSIAEPIAAFFRSVWDESSTAESVRGARHLAAVSNPSVPCAEPPAVAYLRDEEVIGYLGTIPTSFWDGNAEIPGYWLKGFMVLPEYRNGPVGFSMLKEILKYVEVSGILTVAPPARRLFAAVGYADCGVLPNFLSILNPSGIAEKLDVSALGLGLPNWLHHLVRFSQRAGLAAAIGSMFGLVPRLRRLRRARAAGFEAMDAGADLATEDLDDLWRQARLGIAAGAKRSAPFMSRYSSGSGETYQTLHVREAAGQRRLKAVAVVRRPAEDPDARLHGIRVATLADILFCPAEPDAGVAAVLSAERAARRMGADALLCSTAHPAIVQALDRCAWLRLPGNVHLMIRDGNHAANLRLNSRDWWVMRGDASADEAF